MYSKRLFDLLLHNSYDAFNSEEEFVKCACLKKAYIFGFAYHVHLRTLGFRKGMRFNIQGLLRAVCLSVKKGEKQKSCAKF